MPGPMPRKDVRGEPALRRITPSAIDHMRDAIVETGGREVFFAGALDAAGRVCEVRVCARGNDDAVPALFEGLRVRDVVLHNHPSGNLEPSEADLDLASVYSVHGHGVLIVDNGLSRVYVVVEPFLPQQAERLDPEELARFFRPDGKLARTLPQFEVRPQQEEMMEAVAQAFNQDGIAAVEAPTGVGKTVAYLLPAALWAVRNKERVVVSTRTINLQEQIVYKDIPLLQQCLKETFTCCLVKGRGNYLCWRKLERLLSEASLFDDDRMREQVEAIAEWAEKTAEGDREDLPFVPERELWDRLCSESDTCAMGRCPDQQKCFVTRARRQVAKADILVVNHHMLFADLAIKRELGDFSALSVLPSYQRLIFDEAHSVEDSATEYMGVSAVRLGALATLSRFLRTERGQERGLIPFLRLKLVKDCPQLPVDAFEVIQDLIERQVLPEIALARETLNTAFDALRALAAAKCGEIGRDIKWRLKPNTLQDPDVRAVHADFVLPSVEAVTKLNQSCLALLRLLQAIPPDPESKGSPIEMEMLQLSAYAKRLERLALALAESTSEELAENTVRWIEIDAENPSFVKVARCPLEVGKPLADWLYSNLKTIVMTSATLTVRREFDYLFGRLGMDLVPRDRLNAVCLDTPFDFGEQALLGIFTGLVSPSERGFLDESVDAVREVLRITRGHAFVLFTSFYALDYTYRRLRDDLRASHITPLRQGEASRTQLLERFRSDTASVLFATDSFWEGVDVAGRALQCVILPRLPFRVPTEPILEARAEAIDDRGGNSFLSYSVPQAVIKFRQGFGRLIRRRTDRGAVVVLDSRIVTKFYGRIFVESLPGVRMVRGSRDEVLQELTEFFDELHED
ncbi:MAG: DEAD/DEAH box helicase family protein [Candidatus Hydrogenedentes bacterium]|nr:DEAD/DEAH box helicase family protein [Candidatus Hydrogenedentota bacterium]